MHRFVDLVCRLAVNLGAPTIGVADVDLGRSEAALTRCLSDQVGRVGAVDLFAQMLRTPAA